METDPPSSPEPREAEPREPKDAQPIQEDPRGKTLRQIRLALILEAGLIETEKAGAAGFDPYNSRAAPVKQVWGPRRRT